MLDQSAQTLTLKDMRLHAGVLRKGGEAAADLRGNLTVHTARDTLTLDGLTGTLAGAPMTGALHVSHLQTAPLSAGFIAFEPFDLQKMLTVMGVNPQPLQAGKKVQGRIDFSTTGSGLDNLTAEGTLQAETVRVAQLLLADAKVNLRLHQGILDLLP